MLILKDLFSRLIVISILYLISSSVSFSASFDCRKAISYSEKSVCNNQLLSDLDSKLGLIYKEKLSLDDIDKKKEITSQRNWIKNIREKCESDECLISAYEERIADLSQLNTISSSLKIEDVKAICKSSNATTCFNALKLLAERGDNIAQFQLGRKYYLGEGITQDYKQSIYWYQKAAEQDNSAAQTQLGFAYYMGEGVAQDDKQSIYWYQKAAEQGVALAQTMLGSAYLEGKGIAQDDKQAVYWYHQAAEQGDALAQNKLAVMYYLGKGVTQDYKQSAFWDRKAAEQGNASSQTRLGFAYIKGVGVIKDDKQAKDWLIKAVLQGQTEAMFFMGALADTKTEKYAWLNIASSFGLSHARELRDSLSKDMTPELIEIGQKRTRELQAILTEAGVK